MFLKLVIMVITSLSGKGEQAVGIYLLELFNGKTSSLRNKISDL